jgi:hypothetical protein
MACAGSWIGEQSGSSVTFDPPNMMRVMQGIGESSGSPGWGGQAAREEVSSGERTVVDQEVSRRLQFGEASNAGHVTLLDWQLEQAVRLQQQNSRWLLVSIFIWIRRRARCRCNMVAAACVLRGFKECWFSARIAIRRCMQCAQCPLVTVLWFAVFVILMNAGIGLWNMVKWPRRKR